MTCNDNTLFVCFHELDKSCSTCLRFFKAQVIVERSCSFVTATPAFYVSVFHDKDVFAIFAVFFEQSFKPVELCCSKLIFLISVESAFLCHKDEVVACFWLCHLKVRSVSLDSSSSRVNACTHNKWFVKLSSTALPVDMNIVVAVALPYRVSVRRISENSLICLIFSSICNATILVVYDIA